MSERERVDIASTETSHVVCCLCGVSRLKRMKGVGGWTPWMCWEEGCFGRTMAWAIRRSVTDRRGRETGERVWVFAPVAKQVVFLERARALRRAWAGAHPGSAERPATRILYGGSAGASKSHGLRHALYRECLSHRDLTCLMLRRTYKQLKDTHLRQMVREQHRIGAQFVASEMEMRFPATGAVIVAGHCESDADAEQYLSTDYDRIVFDELVTFNAEPAQEIMSRARTPMTKESVWADGGAQVWAGSNPGGRGAAWVKEFFVDREVDREKYPGYLAELYDFVPANLDDNPYLDPGYRRSLMQLSTVRQRQLLDGDWNAFAGQFFDFQATQAGAPWHVADVGVTASTLSNLRVGLALDWGNSSPGCVLFGCALPDGHVHIFDEYKFQRQSAKEVAEAVRARCEAWKLTRVPSCACDPSLLPAKTGERGEWIGQTLIRHGLPVMRVSNERVSGWQRVHEALAVDAGTGTPWLTVHPRCRYLARTVPLMVQADTNPEDVDSQSDDHACDALRYLLMGGLRPAMARAILPPVEPYSLAWYRQRFRTQPRGVLA